MKSIALPFFLALAIGSTVCIAGSPPAQSAASSSGLSCTIGPANKIFGKSHWLVYGCDDGHSVVVISAPGSPAMPLYFFFVVGSKGMQLNGEGTGNKQATDAAYAELKLLSEADVAALFEQAMASNNHSRH